MKTRKDKPIKNSTLCATFLLVYIILLHYKTRKNKNQEGFM